MDYVVVKAVETADLTINQICDSSKRMAVIMQINADLDVEQAFNVGTTYWEPVNCELNVADANVANFDVDVVIIKIIVNHVKGIRHYEKVVRFLDG